MTVKLLLLVVAIILFVLEALHVTSKVSLGWFGMAFFAGAIIA
jgi:hypothetical protein